MVHVQSYFYWSYLIIHGRDFTVQETQFSNSDIIYSLGIILLKKPNQFSKVLFKINCLMQSIKIVLASVLSRLLWRKFSPPKVFLPPGPCLQLKPELKEQDHQSFPFSLSNFPLAPFCLISLALMTIAKTKLHTLLNKKE